MRRLKAQQAQKPGESVQADRVAVCCPCVPVQGFFSSSFTSANSGFLSFCLAFLSFQSDRTSLTSVGEISPQIKPRQAFGVSKGVRNNLLLPDEESVIFPSGLQLVHYNIHQQRAKFLHGKPADRYRYFFPKVQ